MVKAIFNAGTGVLESTFSGEVTLGQIIDYIDATRENKTYPRTLKILTDASDAVMNVAPDELKLIVDANNRSLERYDMIIDAIVLSSPKETALSVLYQELAKARKYKFEVFSTAGAANHWLKIN